MIKKQILVLSFITVFSLASCNGGKSSSRETESTVIDSSTTIQASDTSENEKTTVESTTSLETSESSSESSTSEEEVFDINKIDSWFKYNDVDEDILKTCIEESKEYYVGLDFKSENIKEEVAYLMQDKKGLSYDGVKNAMKITDRDWDLSPDSSDSNPFMRIIYAEYNFDETTAAKYNDINTIWDREHIWAKSKGGNFGTSIGPGTDIHHLRSSDKPNNNNHRNSRNFGFVENGNIGKDYKGNNSGKYSGGNTDGIYEPVDRDKGDVARACFYMNLVYPNACSSLTNSPVGSGNALGILDDLLEWNRMDPPDEFELRRNNLIFEKYQFNRNVFVDCPQLADIIFK